MDDAWWAMQLLQIGLVVPVALFMAWALRRSGVPGGAWGGGALGGLIAAALIGPAVMGRTLPEFHGRVFRGGVAEARAVEEAAAEVRVRIGALEATGVSEVAVIEAERDASKELEVLRGAHRAAVADHAGRSWWVVTGLAALHAAMALVAGLPAGGRAWSRAGGRAWSRAGRALWAQRGRPAGAGALALLIAGAPVAAALALAPGLSGAVLIGWALVFAVPGCAASMRATPFVVALTGLIVGALIFMGVTPSLGMFVVVTFAALGAMLGLGWPAIARQLRRPCAVIMATVTMPALVGLAGVHVDPSRWTLAGSSWAFMVPMLMAVLWAPDGRWSALAIACRVTGVRGVRWSEAGAIVNAGAGSVELVLAVVAYGAWIGGVGGVAGADDRVLGAALVGVVMIEMTRGVRAAIGRMLDGR